MEQRADLVPSIAAIRALFGAAAASCALVTDSGDALVFVAADGAGAERIVGVELPLNRGIAGWVAMTDQAISIREVRRDGRFAKDVAEATEYVPDALLAVPIPMPHGETAGVIEVLDPATDFSSGWPLAVLGTCATLLGIQLASESSDGSAIAPTDGLTGLAADISRRGGEDLAADVLTAIARHLDEDGR